jgi:hypothetical protein
MQSNGPQTKFLAMSMWWTRIRERVRKYSFKVPTSLARLGPSEGLAVGAERCGILIVLLRGYGILRLNQGFANSGYSL